MGIRDWVRLPSSWIEAGGLKNLRWTPGGGGADNAAALMALAAIAHVADPETGTARATYDQLCQSTGLSRAKLSNGLTVLQKISALTVESERSMYRLRGYSTVGGWAKFPGKSMYAFDRIAAFDQFRLRQSSELDALKLFFLFVARRDRSSNRANIGYDKIQEYTEIPRPRIKTAISFLASLSLVYVEHVASKLHPDRIASAYRIVGIESFNHMGTRGRGEDIAASEPDSPIDYSGELG